ncbi:MAG TPA: pyridoxal-phosphate dependent enzyme, partial [Polyangiaceae bacterium]|nr:pyridoxal-phosphate dependent enzyme [Polyangiaceae bacterium]
MGQRALTAFFPELAARVPFAELGQFPSPVEPLAQLVDASLPHAGDTYVKRDDISSPSYGGNKVRTLESLFGSALQQGNNCHVVAVGAYGSNHAVATVLHAARLGLSSGAMVFPQPFSATARDNLRVTVAKVGELYPLWHWLSVPFAIWDLRRRLRRRGTPSLVMPPGGANPIGALGYVSAALELAEQVRAGELPAPQRIVLGVGSTCTSAGLLLGCALAARMGIGFERRPQVVSIRVTPWPVTSRFRIVSLAHRTSALLHRLSGDARFAFSQAELADGLRIDGRFLGAGYGRATADGLQATQALAPWGPQALDTTYGAKSAAGLLATIAEHAGPTVYWATKSSVPLPDVDDAALSRAPKAMLNWLRG